MQKKNDPPCETMQNNNRKRKMPDRTPETFL